MNFDLSDEQLMLRDSAERYVRDSYSFDFRTGNLSNPSGCSDQQWANFAELGWLGVGIPEEMGGLGCSIIETAILCEELGRGLVLEPYLSTAVLCSEILRHVAAGTELLPLVADGKLRLALAHGEKDTRYGTNEPVSTQATPTDAGFRLDGTKTLVLDAPSAHQLLVTARRPSTEGPSLFLVPSDSPGVELSPYLLIEGSRGADVVFTAVDLPASALVLEGEQLTSVLSRAIDRSELALAAAAVGAMEQVMAITGDYVKTREQFGQLIGKFQALQHRLAEMFVEVQESRSALYRGLAYFDAEASERSRAVSAAKVAIARSGKLVGALGIQLHGGYGMTEEYQVGHYFRFLTAYEKKFGDLGFHLNRMSAE